MTLQAHADAIIHRAVRHGSELPPLVTICAWCPDSRAKTEEAARLGLRVSHGMCPACVLRFEDREVTT